MLRGTNFERDMAAVMETPEIQKNTASIGVPILPYSVREIAKEAGISEGFHPGLGNPTILDEPIGGMEQLAVEWNPNRFNPYDALDKILIATGDYTVAEQVHALRAYITGMEK